MPTPPIRLVATDLDGTLLRSDATVSARTRKVLRDLRDRAVRHVIVTGRPSAGCVSLFRSLSYRGLAVCGQGAQIYDADREILMSWRELDRDVARAFVGQLVARIGQVYLAVVTSGHRAEFVITPGFTRGDEQELAPFRAVPGTELWADPIDKVLLRHEALSDADLVAEAAACCLPGLVVTHAGPGIVELIPSGFDKATGLSRVAEAYGISAAEVVAFGDMPNDIPMLAWAGRGIAMSNGHPELKTVADEIAPGNDEDGLAVALDRLLDAAGHTRALK
ncbi:Cof-type HAD-IIB family hydrolase (plasmid) [Streptomyces sp. NBC_00715]|uniref:HAD family hydrolase n=1 Tax=Streptomyces sp. NBC_00715 TaxID=2975811 RepID=UPI002F91B340